MLGALNAITHEVVTVTNDSYINALSVCDLLRKLAAKHADEVVTLFLDNARYQKCNIVTELAAQLKVELIYLPAYSPNLNLIERLWRHVKHEVLYSRYYDSFPKFKTAIMGCVRETLINCLFEPCSRHKPLIRLGVTRRSSNKSAFP